MLKPLFEGDERDSRYENERAIEWRQVASRLHAGIGRGKVGKARDVEMIISALTFVGELPNKNIVAYSVARIRAGELREHYKEIQPRYNGEGIRQVGPKVAALYLRDLVSAFQLADLIDGESAFCLQPIDVWVRRIAEKLGIVGKDESEVKVQRAIVRMCEKENVSAMHFNQGAWYIGTHSLEIVLDELGKSR